MPLGTEFQPIGKDWLGSNDKLARDTVGAVVSRGAFALNVTTIVGTQSLDYHYNLFLINTVSGVPTFTLPFANTLSTTSGSTAYIATKAMFMVLLIVVGANNATIAAQAAGDTINGGASISIAPGVSTRIISDGVSKWYII